MLNIKNITNQANLLFNNLKTKLTFTLEEIISSQQELLLPWIIVLYSIGICCYFSLNNEPSIIYPIISMIILAALFNKSIVFVILFYIALGFLITQTRAISLKAPILSAEIKFCHITGIISDISIVSNGKKIIIDDPVIKNQDIRLKKLKLLAKTSLNNAKPGDEISIMANINKPPAQITQDGYDFALRSYFEQIGAVGYAISEAKILKKAKNNNIMSKVGKFRSKMLSDINGIIGPKTGNIASALMIGEYNGIEEKILTNMRIAGISHILSVSGMHLSLMAMICYFASRIIINLLYSYTAKLHSKKIASIIALLGSFAYLLISGLQVAAIRSFIMVAMTIFAVMFDRINSAMRSIFLAGLLILIISPQNILNPSFQMSFAAVIALIASYSYYISKFPMQDNIYSKIRLYFISTTFSSIIAGAATAPYVIYHFNQFSTYSVLANLLAVPLTSFIIMPCVILGFILYPLNLLKLALIPMSWAISKMIVIADYISGLPYASINIPHMSTLTLALISIGGLIYCLFKDHYRLFGVIPMIIGVVLMIAAPRPILIIDGKTKIFAYFDEDNQMILSSKKLGKFTKNLWLKYMGTDNVSYYTDNNEFFYKEGEYCHYIYNNSHLKFTCDDKKYLHLTGKPEFLNEKLNISDDFTTDFIYLKNGYIVAKSITKKNRPW